MLKNAQVVASLPATDMDRAKKFYTDKLGLEATDTPAPETVMFTNDAGMAITLYKREQGTKADHTVAIWLVNDVEDTVEDLINQGITFEQYDMPNIKTDERGIAQLGNSTVAWFKDTEGNILSVSEVA